MRIFLPTTIADRVRLISRVRVCPHSYGRVARLVARLNRVSNGWLQNGFFFFSSSSSFRASKHCCKIHSKYSPATDFVTRPRNWVTKSSRPSPRSPPFPPPPPHTGECEIAERFGDNIVVTTYIYIYIYI